MEQGTRTERPPLDEELSEDASQQSLGSDSDDSWDDEEDGSLAGSLAPSEAAAEEQPSAALDSQPAPQQHQSSVAATTSASPPKAPLGKTGAWFKKAFAAGKASGGKPGGWAASLKQSVSRMSADSTASDESDATASGNVTPQTGSPRKRFTVSRLSAQSGAQEASMLRTNSNGSLGSDAQEEEEMPAPPVAAGGVQLGGRLPTHRKNRVHTELADIALVQELDAHSGVIWAAAFSRRGRHLATGGQDAVVRLWAVLPDRSAAAAAGSLSEDVADAAARGILLPVMEACPVFESAPAQEWRGHEREVLALGWSRTDFLASGSMDGDVRLWHPSRPGCLRVFKHSDWVTAVQFHPSDDTQILSTSVDGKVRLWSVPERRVLDTADVHEMATAAGWAPGGSRVAVGTLKGKVRFYSVDDAGRLEYEAQIDVKNRRGKSKSGRKVTGLAFQPTGSLSTASGGSGRRLGRNTSGVGNLLLVTSGDARLRLFDGYGLVCKAKGPSLGESLISAAFSPNGRHMTCGSEDGWAFMWDAVPGDDPEGPPAKNTSWEAFFLGPAAVTSVLLAPDAARRPHSALAAAAANRLGAPWGPPEPAVARSSKYLTGSAAAAVAAGEASMWHGDTFGAVFVATTDAGKIIVAESLAAPQWL